MYNIAPGCPVVGRVVGWLSASDVDSKGEPAFISEKNGEPAALFRLIYEYDGKKMEVDLEQDEIEENGQFLEEEEEEASDDVPRRPAQRRRFDKTDERLSGHFAKLTGDIHAAVDAGRASDDGGDDEDEAGRGSDDGGDNEAGWGDTIPENTKFRAMWFRAAVSLPHDTA